LLLKTNAALQQIKVSKIMSLTAKHAAAGNYRVKLQLDDAEITKQVVLE